MMQKLFRGLGVFLVTAVLVGGGWSVIVSAAPVDKSALPETDGVYAVPGRPDLRLRVIVYHGRPDDVRSARSKGRPTPTPPEETCSPTNTVDLNSDAVDNPAGWTLPDIWTYRVNTSSIPSTIGVTNGRQLITNGFATWQSELVGKVTFEKGNDTTISKAQRDGQNVVTWGRTSGSALAVTYTWYSTVTEKAVEIDTIFNKSFTWYWSNPDTWAPDQTCAFGGVYDAQDILTHELGHTVGLNDHYTGGYVNNTMYGYGSTGETKKNTLTTGDKSGVARLYQ